MENRSALHRGTDFPEKWPLSCSCGNSVVHSVPAALAAASVRYISHMVKFTPVKCRRHRFQCIQSCAVSPAVPLENLFAPAEPALHLLALVSQPKATGHSLGLPVLNACHSKGTVSHVAFCGLASSAWPNVFSRFLLVVAFISASFFLTEECCCTVGVESAYLWPDGYLVCFSCWLLGVMRTFWHRFLCGL